MDELRKSAVVEALIRAALEEDLGEIGDITTAATVPRNKRGRAVMKAKQAGVVAGLRIAGWVFEKVDRELVFESLAADGERVDTGSVLARIEGALASILIGERAALNFVSRLSGIATHTNRFVAAVAGTKARILDTRKTTPGWRELEKYAVRCGGGENHRMGLYDQVLIKDNHIAAVGSIAEAVKRARLWLEQKGIECIVEVEVSDLEQVREAIEAGADRILLDNMPVETMRKAISLGAGRVEFEASGNVSLETVREIAETGVDFISIGALTHSAPAFDVSLQVVA